MRNMDETVNTSVVTLTVENTTQERLNKPATCKKIKKFKNVSTKADNGNNPMPLWMEEELQKLRKSIRLEMKRLKSEKAKNIAATIAHTVKPSEKINLATDNESDPSDVPMIPLLQPVNKPPTCKKIKKFKNVSTKADNGNNPMPLWMEEELQKLRKSIRLEMKRLKSEKAKNIAATIAHTVKPSEKINLATDNESDPSDVPMILLLQPVNKPPTCKKIKRFKNVSTKADNGNNPMPLWMEEELQKLRKSIRLEMKRLKSEKAKNIAATIAHTVKPSEKINVATDNESDPSDVPMIPLLQPVNKPPTCKKIKRFKNVSTKADNGNNPMPLWMKEELQKLRKSIRLEMKRLKSEKAKNIAATIAHTVKPSEKVNLATDNESDPSDVTMIPLLQPVIVADSTDEENAINGQSHTRTIMQLVGKRGEESGFLLV